MTDIVTITPNPAVNLSTSVERIVPVSKLRGTSQRRDPGGGGINVARVIKRLGEMSARSTLWAARREACCANCSTKKAQQAGPLPSRRKRAKISLSAKSAPASHTASSCRGRGSVKANGRNAYSCFPGSHRFPRFVVASGSLPSGVLDDFYARVARIAKQRGAKMILDTSGQALVADGVDLIKPNLREMRELAGNEPSDAKEWEAAARALVHSGKVAVIALTMGHLGGVLVTRDQVLRAQPLPIMPISAVGAGDSFLGALIWRLAAGAGSPRILPGRPLRPAPRPSSIRAPIFTGPTTSNVLPNR
jgi:6-phosphofructokinase 2